MKNLRRVSMLLVQMGPEQKSTVSGLTFDGANFGNFYYTIPKKLEIQILQGFVLFFDIFYKGFYKGVFQFIV